MTMRTHVSAGSSGKNADIEVLRAVAVGFTVLCHLGELLKWNGDPHSLVWIPDFWGGVDIFFCVSGFVITHSLLRMPRRPAFRDLAIPFYIRRVFRIWPAATLWLAIPILAAKYFNTSGAFGHAKAAFFDGVAAVAQVANIYFSFCQRGAYGPCGKEMVYWSLSLEEQFYLVFPLLLFFIRPPRLRWLLAALILIQFALPRDAPDLLWFIRTDAICYGVLIAMASHNGSMQAVSSAVDHNPRGAMVLAVLLMALVAILSMTPALRINVALIALAAAGLVLLASCERNVIIPSRRLRPFLLWCGSRSFAIYLAHRPCFWATREIFYRIYHLVHFNDTFAPAFVVTAGVFIAVASEATYRFVETPLRELGRRLADRVGQPAASVPEPLSTTTVR